MSDRALKGTSYRDEGNQILLLYGVQFRMNSEVLVNIISQQLNFNFLKLSTISKSCAEEHPVKNHRGIVLLFR